MAVVRPAPAGPAAALAAGGMRDAAILAAAALAFILIRGRRRGSTPTLDNKKK